MAMHVVCACQCRQWQCRGGCVLHHAVAMMGTRGGGTCIVRHAVVMVMAGARDMGEWRRERLRRALWSAILRQRTLLMTSTGTRAGHCEQQGQQRAPRGLRVGLDEGQVGSGLAGGRALEGRGTSRTLGCVFVCMAGV